MSEFFAPYEGSVPFVFVSYAHKDSAIVLPLIRGLQERGIRVWYDGGVEVGTEWPDYIAKHLRRSSCVIAFVSTNFDASHNCRREITFAINLLKNPIVIYLEDEKKFSDGMQMQLCALHAMYFDRYPDAESFLGALSTAEILKPCFAVPDEEMREKQNSVPGEQPNKPEEDSETTGQEVVDSGDIEPEETERSELSGVEPQEEVQHFGSERTIDAEECSSSPEYGAEVTLDKEQSLDDLYQLAEVRSGENRFPEAAKLFKKAAQKGHPMAQYRLGCCYRTGSGVKKISSEARTWFQKAAEQNVAEACYVLAECYERGIGGVDDVEAALIWYEKAVELGFAADDAVLRCKTRLYRRESREAWLDDEELYQKAMEQERSKRYKDAARMLKKAAGNGHVKSQIQLARFYGLGRGVEKDAAKAVYWYRKAAEQGDAYAKHSLGGCYWYGIGVAPSAKEAIAWYRESAEQGYPDSCRELGYIYKSGYHVQKDAWEALKWYRKARELGCKTVDDDIINKCEVMVKEEAEAYVEKAKAIYAEGKLEDAVMMYQMAAERGNVDACFGLAECYFTGKGITQDYVEALKWYTLAAEQGHKEAAQKARKCKWNLFWKK